MNKYLKKKSICIIPARGGSKRIPNKNIKNFFGKPIIYYPIKVAINSKLFDKVVVSTDSKKIAKISKNFGAEVHNRVAKFADNLTTTPTVIKNVIDEIDENKDYLKVCCIYPTSIFITKKILEKAFKNLKKSNFYIFSASKFLEPIERSFFKKNNKIEMLKKKNYNRRSQDSKIFYYDAAQFYLGWRKSWIFQKNIFSGKNKFLEFQNFEFQDINNHHDWLVAKEKWKNLKKFSKNKKKY
jgi:pseudaminic acid cytidylyltransferase